MHFNQVIGQQQLTGRLVHLLKQNRLSHAILMLGPEGSGVLPIAIQFAQWVVSVPMQAAAPKPAAVPDLFGTTSPLPAPAEDSPLQEWQFPAEIDSAAAVLQHPDLHLSFPVIPRKTGDKPTSNDWIKEFRTFYQKQPYGNVFDWLQYINAENKQGNITAAECERLIHALNLKTFKARYKVVVMWMPEYLGKEGNKLLKIIEEPPANTLFLLAAEQEDNILPTILSRCQIIRVPALRQDDIALALQQQQNLSEVQARQIAIISDGNYREALQILHHHQGEDWNNLLRDWLNAALATGAREATRYAQTNQVVGQLADLGRERQKQLLRYFLQLIEVAIRIKALGSQQVQVAPTEAAFAERLLKIAGLGTLRQMAHIINQYVYYIERNANARLLFTALTIKIRSLVHHKLELQPELHVPA